MYFQDKPGIYAYKLIIRFDLHADLHIRLDTTLYESLEDYFRRTSYNTIQHGLGYSVNDRICQHVIRKKHIYRWGWYREDVWCNKISCTDHQDSEIRAKNASVIYDHNGNIYSPDRIVGLYREWVNNNHQYYNYNSWRKRNRRSARSVNTFHERKWANAWDDEGFGKFQRGHRKHLPDGWFIETNHVHHEKGWKKQSKRKFQWKAK